MRASAALRELPRKLFHLLSLVYYLAYRTLGPSRAALWMGVWTSAIAAAEIIRLAFPRLNRLLLKPFAALIRPEEKTRLSGLFHTTMGTFLLFAIFGKDSLAVAFAIGCAAFGDAAAALGGKALGRHALGRGKTLEGSLSCFGACLLIGLVLGVPWPAAFFASAAATALEFLPATAFFNDNLWMPLASAAALHIAARK